MPTTQIIDEQASRAFETYCNYLVALELVILDAYGPSTDLARNVITAVRSTSGTQRIRPRPPNSPDLDLTRELRLAWSFETALFRIAVDRPSVEAEDLHGIGPLAYFAVYSAARAFFVASNMAVRDTHSAALKKLNEQVVTPRGLLPVPWAVHCTGGPARQQMCYQGLPASVTVG
jgi:hypothetical protein